MYCKNCGKEISDNVNVCPECGQPTENVNISVNSTENLKKMIPMTGRPKNKVVSIILCIFFGWLGAHRFYEGKIGTGILYLLTFGVFGFGIIADLILLIQSPNPYYSGKHTCRFCGKEMKPNEVKCLCCEKQKLNVGAAIGGAIVIMIILSAIHSTSKRNETSTVINNNTTVENSITEEDSVIENNIIENNEVEEQSAVKEPNITVEVPVETTTAYIPSPAELESNYKKNCIIINDDNYKDFIRNSDNYKNKPVCITIKVNQTNIPAGLFNTDNYLRGTIINDDWSISNDVVFKDSRTTDTTKILEDDEITIFGTFTGLMEFKTVLGEHKECPVIDMHYITFH